MNPHDENSNPSPQFDLACQHIELLTGSADTPVCFRGFRDDKTTDGARNLSGKLSDLWPEIEAMQRDGWGVYVIVNCGGQTDASIAYTRAAFIDCDGKPIPDSWHVEPDFIVRRDHTHWHAYWRSHDIPLTQFRVVQKRLAAYYGTDPKVCNLSRVMRLAGTLHQKDVSNPALITIEPKGYPKGDPRYRHARLRPELLAGLPDVSVAVRERHEVPEGVRLDRADTITWARDRIRQDLADNGGPVDLPGGGGGSDQRTVDFTNTLLDGNRYGYSLSVEKCAELLHEAWAPHFDYDWIEDKVANAYRYRQNDPGCASAGTGERTFGPAVHNLIWREYCQRHGLDPVAELSAPVRLALADAAMDELDRPTAAETALPPAQGVDDREAVNEGRWPLTHIRDRATALARPEPVMLVAEIVPDRKLIMPWGDTGCGKTYWALEVATAVAMRRPAFGKYPIVKPGEAGIAVIFAGEDCDFLDRSRLTVIEQHYQRSLQGLVYTVDTAIPINDPALFETYRDELRRLQDITGKPIDVIVNDTLKRSLGMLKQNDDDTGRRFTVAMEGLISEFACSLICNAHQPKSGADGGIAGSGDFTANCPVTPHLIGEKDSNGTLKAIRCRFEPKFRVGPAPLPFTAKAIAAPLPRPVAGFTSDLVLVALSAQEEVARKPAHTAKMAEQEDCRIIERTLWERAARDLDSAVTTEAFTLYLAGDRLEGESENDYAERRSQWKTKLDNGARRPEGNPAFARFFEMDHRAPDGDTLRIRRPVRKWFVKSEPQPEAGPGGR